MKNLRFHIIWLPEDSSIPEPFEPYVDSWLEHHPKANLQMWDSCPPEGLQNQEAYDKAKTLAQKADILRFEILYNHGGVYADADMECLRSLEDLILQFPEGFAGCEEPGIASTGLIYAPPKSPVMRSMISRISQGVNPNEDPTLTTGPQAFSQVVKSYPNFALLPPSLIYPTHASCKRYGPLSQAYTSHHWFCSWKDIKAPAGSNPVSILMPVRNTEPGLLMACWSSILQQTYNNWELILVDDRTENIKTGRILEEIARHPRVLLLTNPQHLGVSASLQRGLQECSFQLVARMDSDDIMFPRRLESQVSYMAENPSVDILGAQIRFRGTQKQTTLPYTVNHSLVETGYEGSPFWLMNHPTVVFRKSKIQALGGYYPQHKNLSEDYHLWLRALSAGLTLRNLPYPVLDYNNQETTTIKASKDPRWYETLRQWREEFLQTGELL